MALQQKSLNSVKVKFNYFDIERFSQEHGDARPCYGDLRSTDKEVEKRNKSRHTFSYFTPFERPVYDARPIQNLVDLDTQGFTILPSPTKMQRDDFYRKARVESIYLQECANFLKKATGATKVLPFDYVVRNLDLAKEKKAAGYAFNRPHNDHTLLSGPRRTRELLGEDKIHDLLLNNYRFALMNVWRRWDGGNSWPLACCSYESLDYNKDMCVQDLVYPHRTGETYTVRRSNNHQYYWFSDMTKDEAIILKIYDSDSSRARGSLHTGFDNPNAKHDPTRESMEVRCIVLFGPEELTSQATLRGAKVATNVEGGVMGPSGHDNIERGKNDSKKNFAKATKVDDVSTNLTAATIATYDSGTQSDKDQVKAVLQEYIDGTVAKSEQRLRNVFHSSAAIMNGYIGSHCMLGTPEPFFTSIEKAKHSPTYEGMVSDDIHVNGNVASGYIVENGYSGGISFVDYFHLLRENGKFKIMSKCFHGKMGDPVPLNILLNGSTTEHNNVKAVLQEYIDATAANDESRIRKIFRDDSKMNGFSDSRVYIGTPEVFFKMVPNMKHPSNYKGIVLNDSIHITGNAAIGSLTEEYFNGDTHFTDHFHLLKGEDGTWKIISKIYQGNKVIKSKM